MSRWRRRHADRVARELIDEHHDDLIDELRRIQELGATVTSKAELVERILREKGGNR